MKQENRNEALKLVRQLSKLSPDPGVLQVLSQVQGWIKMPMAEVLAKVPGHNVTEQCRLVGVSRQAWYAWQRGESRPNPQQAKRLAELTGFDADVIRGRPLRPPPRPAPARPARASRGV
jgi:transcriptional regulator with XRE-family HTH domain